MQNDTLNKHILITGMQRSGTTFTAKIVNNSSKFTYLPEPFNPNYFELSIEQENLLDKFLIFLKYYPS